MFGGLNRVGIEAGEKGLFLERFWVKIGCTGEATASLACYCVQFGTIAWSLHAIAWLSFKILVIGYAIE